LHAGFVEILDEVGGTARGTVGVGFGEGDGVRAGTPEPGALGLAVFEGEVDAVPEALEGGVGPLELAGAAREVDGGGDGRLGVSELNEGESKGAGGKGGKSGQGQQDDPASSLHRVAPWILDFGFWILDSGLSSAPQNPKSKIQNQIATLGYDERVFCM